MKKHLLPVLSFVSILSLPAIAQIPNGGFETWNPGTDWSDPDQWVTYNSVTWSLGTTLSCEQGTPGAVGASFVKVTTRSIPGVGILPGWIYTGEQISGTGGFPYTQRPAALNGKWQYSIGPSDQGVVSIQLNKWNAATQTTDAVGAGVASVAPGLLTTWQNFSANITYFSMDYPDTALISILSSSGAGTAGSTLWIDDLSFGAPVTSVAEQTGQPLFQLGPSPASERLRISAGQQLTDVAVMDMRGRELSRTAINDSSTEIVVAPLPAGVYLARVRFADGRTGTRPFFKN